MRYHMRRKDKQIKDLDEIHKIISEQKHLTIALCKGSKPYLVTMNYGFDKEEFCFYFHCAKEGKKIDYLKSNPSVYGQILVDRGYVSGEYDYNYRTVQFSGEVEFLESKEEKINALILLLKQVEENPEPIIERLKKNKDLNSVSIGKIKVFDYSGKEYNKIKNEQ